MVTSRVIDSKELRMAIFVGYFFFLRKRQNGKCKVRQLLFTLNFKFVKFMQISHFEHHNFDQNKVKIV